MKKPMFWGSLFLLFSILALSWFSLQAQEKLVTFMGSVTDNENNVLPGASVTLKNTETGYSYSTTTRPDGRFMLSGIEPGKYDCEVRLDGFTTQIRKGMTFNIGARIELNFQLTPSPIQQEVTVVAEAPLIEVTKSDISSIVGRKEIDDLPVITRSFANLAMLKPGTAGSGSDIRAGAQPGGSSEVIVDGVSNEFSWYNTMRSDLPADAIQEFRILVNQFSAEYGNATAAVLHAITRSGTNEFRGRAYFFWRDEAFDAKNYFATEKQEFSQYRFGGFLGGPIVKDKLHFFLCYEGSRYKTYSVITSPLVPQESIPVRTVNDQFLLKFNYQLNEKNMFTVRYTRDWPRTFNAGVGGFNTKDRAYDSISWDDVFQGTWTFYPTANSLNEFRIQYSKRWYETRGNELSADPNSYQINRPSGNFGKYWGNPMWWPEVRFQLNDGFTLFLGKHNLKVGVDFNYVDSKVTSYWGWPGIFYFDTDLPFDPNNPATYPYMFDYNAAAPSEEHSNMTSYAFYVQDTWKILPRVTLNFGIRYTNYQFAQNPNQEKFVVSNKLNWDPRVGISWDPFGDGKSVLRASVGKYTNSPMGNVLYASVVNRVEYDERIIYYPGYPDPFKPNPFVPAEEAKIPKELYTYDYGMPCPMSISYSLGAERELFKDFSLAADYVISKGRHLYWFVNKNPVIPGTGSKRPNPEIGNWFNVEAGGRADYRGLYLVLKKRYSHGYGFEIAYTFSNSKADVESGDWNTPSNNEKRYLDYGPTNQDARHRLSITGIVDLPFGLQLSTIFYYRSPLPYSIVYGYDYNKDGINRDYYPEGSHRNNARGPHYYSLDMRISYFLRLKNQYSAQVFVEMFNVTNRVNFANPVGNRRSVNFGKSVSAGDPRLIQLGFRLNF